MKMKCCGELQKIARGVYRCRKCGRMWMGYEIVSARKRHGVSIPRGVRILRAGGRRGQG